MRSLLSLSLAVVFVAGLVVPALAGTEVAVDGQLRFRTEFDDRLFQEDLVMSVYHLLRARLGVGATVSDNAHFYAQFQDSRILGSNDQSGGLVNTQNVDMHQAYVKIMKLWENGPGLKLGRFEVALGNERVYGPYGWDNVGRSWEGAMAWYKAEQVKVTGMLLKGREVQRPFVQRLDDDDFEIYGATADVADPALRFFLTYERDADEDMVVGGDDANNLDRITVGGFFKNELEEMGLDYSLNAAYQMGQIYGPDGIPGADEYDISAFMVNFEAGYTIEAERPVRVGGAIDYTSGDDDATDTDWGAYNNLYYSGHRWRGYMDYFVGQSDGDYEDPTVVTGLIDLMGRAHVELSPEWWLMGDFHYFMTAEEYANLLDPGETTTDVGIEVDITLKTKSIEGVHAMGGASFFMPQDAFAGMEDPQTGMWFYYQFMVNFD